MSWNGSHDGQSFQARYTTSCHVWRSNDIFADRSHERKTPWDLIDGLFVPNEHESRQWSMLSSKRRCARIVMIDLVACFNVQLRVHLNRMAADAVSLHILCIHGSVSSSCRWTWLGS